MRESEKKSKPSCPQPCSYMTIHVVKLAIRLFSKVYILFEILTFYLPGNVYLITSLLKTQTTL